MSIILLFFEYSFYAVQDMGILKHEVAVEHIVPSHGNQDGDDDLGYDKVEAAGLFPQVGMVLHEFHQQIYASYIEDETAYPHQDVLEEYPLELAVLCGECPLVVDDAIGDASRNGTDGGGQYVIDSQPLETDISQYEIGQRGELCGQLGTQKHEQLMSFLGFYHGIAVIR
jgi:hypothetical protein